MNGSVAFRAPLAALVTTLLAGAATPAVRAADDIGSLTGDWSGAALCTPNHDACHDEKALYHLTGPSDRNMVTVVGSKIVDGREIVMGPPSDFRYDPQKKILFLETPSGNVFRFTVAGATMEGTLTLASGELYRRISLKKVVPKAI